MKTSSACCKMAILVQPNFWNSLTLVGLCTVAEGWVRKNVGKRFLSDNAGELAPYESWRRKINHYTTWAMDINSSRLFHVSLWVLRASNPSILFRLFEFNQEHVGYQFQNLSKELYSLFQHIKLSLLSQLIDLTFKSFLCPLFLSPYWCNQEYKLRRTDLTTTRFHILATSAMVVQTVEHPPRSSTFWGGL